MYTIGRCHFCRTPALGGAFWGKTGQFGNFGNFLRHFAQHYFSKPIDLCANHARNFFMTNAMNILVVVLEKAQTV